MQAAARRLTDQGRFPMSYFDSNRNLLVVIAALAFLAIALSFLAHWFLRFPGDLTLTTLFQSLHSSILLSLMKAASYVGEGWRAALLVTVGGAVVWWRLGKLEAGLTVAAGLSNLLDSPLKIVIGRPRPAPDLVHVWVMEQGNGFPSGHAFFASAFLGFIAYLAFTRLTKRVPRILVLSALIVLVLLIGASRVYLGVHWPSDVVGGYVFGGVFLAALIWLDLKCHQPAVRNSNAGTPL